MRSPCCAGRVAARALRILRRLAEKQADMFTTCLSGGLAVTADFHAGLARHYPSSASAAPGARP